MRRLTSIFCTFTILVLGTATLQAEQVEVGFPGESIDVDPIDVLMFFFVGSTPASSTTPNTAEYHYPSIEFGDGGSVKLTEVNFGPNTPANAANLNPFGSLDISIQNDLTLMDGTPIGDAVSFSFAGGILNIDGVLIRQLSVKLLDSTGAMVDGVGFEQIIGLNLGDTTSATYNILTNVGITNGTLTGFSATVVPVPAAGWLMLSAMLAIWGWKKRLNC